MFAHLEKKGESKIFNQPAVRYVGRLGNEQVEVIWLPLQALPARLVRIHGDDKYTLELKEIRQTPDTSWPLADQEQIDAYEWIDGSDLGDMEYDPFVRKVLAMDAGRSSGHSH